jgi:Ras-related protein Rab-11A
MKNFVFKILVAGNGGVGKTTLLRRYVDGVFDDSTIETVGVDFFIKEVLIDDINAHCTLQLWDLGGQERFRYMLENFVMGARGALLLFDMTKMPVISEILEWVNIVRIHDINLPILLVGSKLDLESVIAVDKETGKHIKNTFNMIDYIQTSSKTGYNVSEVFIRIIKYIIIKSKY